VNRISKPLVEIRGVSKRFPGVLALDDVTFEIQAGEVLALVGENGAGKSTLVKILSGVHHPDSGSVVVGGEVVSLHDPHHAQTLGITTVYQETTLVPGFTAVQNIFLGRELEQGPFLDEQGMKKKARLLLREFDTDESIVDVPVEGIGALRQKIVEVLKGLAFEARLVIMDEPTAPLTDREREALFGHIRRLKERNVSVLLVTHRLEELLQIADRAVVLRDGRYVATVTPQETGIRELVHMMVGRDVESVVPFEGEAAGEGTHADDVLRVESLKREGVFDDITFSLRRGEILGVAGLAGSGRTELVRALVGADVADAGDILRNGRALRVKSPKDAIKNGLALAPEERKVQGVFETFTVAKNVSAAALRRILKLGFLISERAESRLASDYVSRLRIRTPSVRQEMRFLSGGNQQKALIARYLVANAEVLILDEPTQGIDVGAKSDIYGLIQEHVRERGAAIVVSSELDDLVRLSDRILVMREGRLAGEVRGTRGKRLNDEEQRLVNEEVLHLALGSAS
jgi:ribose transport system ATP-binding protein